MWSKERNLKFNSELLFNPVSDVTETDVTLTHTRLCAEHQVWVTTETVPAYRVTS